MSVFIIAEIGQAHDGSLGILHSYIDAVAQTGVDGIKFQTHIAEAESSVYEPFRTNFSYEDITRYDYWKRMEFTASQWREIKQHCVACDLEFLSSPFSNKAVSLLEDIGVERFKVGSGEILNFLLLEKIARTGKDIILSSGMSSFNEIDQAVNFLAGFGNNLSVLQCTTQYPTEPENAGLNVISEMIDRYDFSIGFSDHSGTIYPSLAAVTLGAKIIEVHTVFDKRIFGPDTSSSITIDELKQLVEGIRHIETAISHKIDKDDVSPYKNLKQMFGKSLAINKKLCSDHRLCFDDLEAKKPSGYGIPASQYERVIGKQLKHNLMSYDFLTLEDLI
ncbi:MAG: N-acetylneuraminate synthase family protein [Desulfobacter sp.]